MPPHRVAAVTKTPLLIAFGVYLSGATFGFVAFGVTSLLAALLWAVLYALNESYDVSAESNLCVSTVKRLLLYAAWLAIVAGSYFLSPKLLVLFVLMSAGQLAYCVPPIRLKRYWWAAPLLSGVVNPLLRLECGSTWGKHSIPMVALVAIAGVHLSSAIKTRSLLRTRDKALGYRVSPRAVDVFGAVCMVVGFACGGVTCWVGILPKPFFVLTLLAAGYSIYAWTGKAKTIGQVRKGWVWFAILTVFAVASLYYGRR